MTYCVGLLLKEGMVCLSDTRTNAGLDNISTYRKMFHFEHPGERVITVMTAGSLSITQTTLARLREAIDDPDATEDTSIMLAPTMLKVASIIGRMLCAVRLEIDEKLATMKQAATASMIVAGQRKGGAMRLFLIYPEGNFIEASPETPFFQIGETKYGRPILVRGFESHMSFADITKLLMVSFDSTLKANLSVGMPLDLMLYKNDEFAAFHERRITATDPYFENISDSWSTALRNAFHSLPDYELEA